jgi:hypothetical protein
MLQAAVAARIPVLAIPDSPYNAPIMPQRACFAALAGLVLVVLAAPVLANEHGSSADEDFLPHVEIMPFAGYRVGGSFYFDRGLATQHSLDLGDDAAWGVDVGLYRDRASFYELLYSQQDARIDTIGTTIGSLKLRTEYAHIGGTLLFPDQNWFVPYLSMTIGATKFDPHSASLVAETDFSMSLGGGLRLPINEHLAVSLGVRGYLTFIDPSSQIFCGGSGSLNCLFRISATSFYQFEGQVGFVMRF